MTARRAPQPGDTVHFIDYGDPAHLDATVIATHPEYTEDDIVDLRVDEPALGLLRDIEHDEGQGHGYWHWPRLGEEPIT